MTNIVPKGNNQFLRGHNSNRHLSEEELGNNIGGLPVTEQRLREMFNTYDVDGSGFLEFAEVKDLYDKFDNFGVQYSEREIHEQIAKHTIGQNDGKVSFEEFCCIFLSIAQR